MEDLHFLELTDLAELIRTQEISPVEATHQQLDRIAMLDGTLASYAVVTAERAMAEAREAEADIVASRYRGPLHGVPLAVKDLFWTCDVPTRRERRFTNASGQPRTPPPYGAFAKPAPCCSASCR